MENEEKITSLLELADQQILSINSRTVIEIAKLFLAVGECREILLNLLVNDLVPIDSLEWTNMVVVKMTRQLIHIHSGLQDKINLIVTSDAEKERQFQEILDKVPEIKKAFESLRK